MRELIKTFSWQLVPGMIIIHIWPDSDHLSFETQSVWYVELWESSSIKKMRQRMISLKYPLPADTDGFIPTSKYYHTCFENQFAPTKWTNNVSLISFCQSFSKMFLNKISINVQHSIFHRTRSSLRRYLSMDHIGLFRHWLFSTSDTLKLRTVEHNTLHKLCRPTKWSWKKNDLRICFFSLM